MNNASLPNGQQQLRVLGPDESADLTELGQGGEIEYLTVPGYMRRLPRPEKPWGPQNVIRFAGLCGKWADALGMPYDCAVDPLFGKLRVYTVGFLDWMYRQHAPSIGWAKVIEARTLAPIEVEKGREQAAGEENEMTAKMLDLVAERVEDVGVLASMNQVRDYLRGKEIERRPVKY